MILTGKEILNQIKDNNIKIEPFNEENITDINSTPGNNIQGENDMSSADLIISIKIS